MSKKILWIDDEIEILKPHVLFLEKKGYEMDTINNATDAFDMISAKNYNAILLDENMPGIGGLEALQTIKSIKSNLPIIMITKNEEEHIMEEAIGSHIADYLLKPINPNQVLLSLKKILQSDKIIEEKTIVDYQQGFRQISIDLMQVNTIQEWSDLYEKIVNWELKLDKIDDIGLLNILKNQKEEANILFSKFIEKNYKDWLYEEEKPMMSHTIVKDWVKPELESSDKTLILMIDNLRLDQWKIILPLFAKYYPNFDEKLYYSILPTATQYARNSFFSGLMPLEIEKKYPNKWLNDVDEGNKNDHEDFYFKDQLKRLGLGNLQTKYIKILNSTFENKILEDYNRLKENDLITIVYNFIDILSHAKTDNNIINEIIRDDKTFRSLTYNWFKNSDLLKIIKLASEEGRKLILTTDHGTIYIQTPSKVIGDKETSTNLRYKLGRNLVYEPKDVFAITDPESYFLPKINISSKYIFAKKDIFLAYPKNYNHFVNYYKNTYQHGGISLEEVIIPFVVMKK